MSFDTAESEFLNEIKKQYDRDVYWREALDKKATSMIFLSAAIFAFLLLLTMTQIIHPHIYICCLLIVGIVLTISSMSCFMHSSSIRKFHLPYGQGIFFYGDVMLMEIVNQFRRSTKEKFTEHQIKQYLKSMNDNAIELKTKAHYMKIGFDLLLASIIFLTASILAILIPLLL